MVYEKTYVANRDKKIVYDPILSTSVDICQLVYDGFLSSDLLTIGSPNSFGLSQT